MTHDQRVFYLKLASEILVGFGILMFLSLWTPVAALMGWFLDLTIWPIFDGAQAFEGTELRLLVAITGGICAGWGVMFFMLIEHVYRKDPKLGGRLVLIPIVTWFCVDSLGSILAGAAPNAILNMTLLGLFAVPILWPAKDRDVSVSA